MQNDSADAPLSSSSTRILVGETGKAIQVMAQKGFAGMGAMFVEDSSDIRRNGMFLILGLFIGAIHLYFLWSLGAGFYYDGLIYAQLGEALFKEGGLREFYSGPRLYVFQHLAPGIPLLWQGTVSLAGEYGWILFAVIQHAIAASSLLFLFYALRPLLSGPVMLLAAILISANPIYQSLHSRLMTESLTGSMLVCGFAATSHMLLQRSIRAVPVFVLTASAMVAIQIRSQSVVYFLIYFLAVLLLQSKVSSRLMMAACLVSVLCSALVWPAYRFVVTGHGFLPNTSYLALVYALRFNTAPSEAVIARMKDLSLPSALSVERLVSQGIDFGDAAEIGMHLHAIGLDDAAAKKEILSAAWVMRTDSSQVMLNQLRLPILSIGMKYPVFAGNGDTVIHRDFTRAKYAHHAAYWEKWEAGTLRDDYSEELDAIVRFAQDNRGLYDPDVVTRLEESLRPYLVNHPLWLRDPLRLQQIPYDLWVLGGFVGVWVMWRKSRMLAGSLIAVIVATYCMSVSVPVGNARYSYPVMPLYVAGFMMSQEFLFASISRRLQGNHGTHKSVARAPKL